MGSIHVILWSVAIWSGVSAALWVMTWTFYLAIMSLLRANQANTLHGGARSLGKVVLVVGLLLDAALNWIFLSIATLHVSRHALVTQHLGLLISRTDWRGRMARSLCSVWLDPFDPSGKHCNPR